jgi:protein O-GlcNAc transferase
LYNGAGARAGKAPHDKIRIAYLCADFRSHVTAYQLAELFELHDRSRFEVIGVSFSRDDGSEIRARLIKAFDQFIDVYTISDREVAGLLHEREVDIAVDLMGHTLDARLPIFAYRPAPVQVTYLAYASTTGATFMHYIIGDGMVLPADHQSFYSERIVRLPECFLANDTQRAIASRVPERREAGLPEQGFVFCCFNNTVKLQPMMFDIWMRLLQAVEGSVLWLSLRYPEAQGNLRREAQARGVDPDRLVFAQRVPEIADHLARHRLADLFLDTLPYNAHATASDALWAGLPVLTCCGKTFGARVAASLLQAVGLPELVTESLAEYEALGLRLARDPELLGGLRHRLEQNRRSHPLFDTQRLCRHLEDAYATMWEIAQSGQAPRSFDVPARGRER